MVLVQDVIHVLAERFRTVDPAVSRVKEQPFLLAMRHNARFVHSVKSPTDRKTDVRRVQLGNIRMGSTGVQHVLTVDSQIKALRCAASVPPAQSQTKARQAAISVNKEPTPRETPVLRARTVKSQWEVPRPVAIVQPEPQRIRRKPNVKFVKPARIRLVNRVV